MSHNNTFNRKPPPTKPYAAAAPSTSNNKLVVTCKGKLGCICVNCTKGKDKGKKKRILYWSSGDESDKSIECETQSNTTKQPAVPSTVTPDKRSLIGSINALRASKRRNTQAEEEPSVNNDDASGGACDLSMAEVDVVHQATHTYVNEDGEVEVQELKGEVSTEVVGSYVSDVDPLGSFATGHYGPLTILTPIAHSFGTYVDDECRALVDLTQEEGGRTSFELARKSADALEVYRDGNDEIDVLHGLDGLKELGIDTNLVKRCPADFFSQPVVTCFLSTLRQIGMTQISSFADMVKPGHHGQQLLAINQKLNFFFTPLMIQSPNISLLNKNAEPEMKTDTGTGEKVYNTKFWEGNVERKIMRGQTNFSSLEVGLYMPDWVLHPKQLEMHKSAMPFLCNHGPMINGGVMLLSLKNAYLQVFLRNMTSAHTIQARLAGYQPLFLIKNCLLQESSRFGINGSQLSSMDMKPKTYLTFAGYYKGSLQDRNLHIIGMTNCDNNLLVQTDDSQTNNS